MRSFLLFSAAVFALGAAVAQAAPYRVIKTVKPGGEGGFDYVYADSVGRRLYVPRSAPAGSAVTPRIAVFNLDTLEPVGEISGFSAHGAAVDPKSGHGFATSKPVVMWDTRTLAVIKSIDVEGNPDGILFDPFNQRVYILSHAAPNMTVIDSRDGSIVSTIDLGAMPEQAATDGKGHIYVDLADKGQVGVVDARTMMVTARYDLNAMNPAGLALDIKHHILFAACRNPAVMVVLNADSGKILATLPLGAGSDGATFNPKTMEAFSSQGDGTLTVVKEKSPTSFAVEQTVATPVAAKTLSLDAKTGRIFLITAEYAPPPPLAADAPPQQPGRVRRGPMLPDSFSLLDVGK